VSTPAIVEALHTLTAEIVRSAEFRTALRDVVSEMLAARPEAVEMVPIAAFARERSLNVATVRQMAKDGRIEAVRIGKRQWRVRRDSLIQPIRREDRAVSGRELAIERARQLANKLGLASDSR
jgi:excisionase family DNA binding protein